MQQQSQRKILFEQLKAEKHRKIILKRKKESKYKKKRENDQKNTFDEDSQDQKQKTQNYDLQIFPHQIQKLFDELAIIQDFSEEDQFEQIQWQQTEKGLVEQLQSQIKNVDQTYHLALQLQQPNNYQPIFQPKIKSFNQSRNHFNETLSSAKNKSQKISHFKQQIIFDILSSN